MKNIFNLTVKRLCYFLILVCVFETTNAQIHDTIFQRKYNNLRSLVNSDITKTKVDTNSLIKEAEKAKNYKYVVKGYYMLSFANMLEDNAKECFSNAKKSYEIAKKNGYVEGQALALRSIGTQYAKMNALKIANQNFDKALKLIENTKTEEAYEIQGLINNSKLIALGDSQKPEDIAEKLKVSLEVVESYNKLSDKSLKTKLLVSAYTNVGYNYSDLKKVDSAKFYFNKALAIVSPDNNYLLASIHHDIGYMYKENGEAKIAIPQFLNALEFLKTNDSSYLSKKIEILQNLAKSYKAIGDDPKFIETNEKALRLTDSKSRKDIKVLETEIENKDQKILSNEKQSSFKNNFFIIAAIAGLAIIGSILYINFKNKRKYTQLRKKLELIIKSPNHISLSAEMSTLDSETQPEENESLDKVSLEENTASQRTTERILTELENFEKSEDFLSSNFTISHLAIQLDTNTKTLSQIIKIYKKQNFNAYVNQLRILHFAKKIEQDEEFRKYKLSYISEYLGYSSASAFSNSFKSVTGMLPSVYLKGFKS